MTLIQVSRSWDRFYDCLVSVGRTSGKLATAVLGLVVQKFAPGVGDRILLGMDDSPTSRYGRHVEGAGVHHNPTAGPADGEWLYGHRPPLRGGARVTLAWLATHPAWGVIALPLRSMLYVREVDVPKLAEKSQLSDRSDRPWDNEDRRPSHADRRRSISREMLGKKFLAALPVSPNHRKLWTLFQDLLALAA